MQNVFLVLTVHNPSIKAQISSLTAFCMVWRTICCSYPKNENKAKIRLNCVWQSGII